MLSKHAKKYEIKGCDSGKNIFIIDRANRQIKKEELKYRLEEYGKIKCTKIRQDKYRRLGIACFEIKKEANLAIQDLNDLNEMRLKTKDKY